jgi:hypothetical protein
MAPRPAACLHRLPFAALLALACTARQDAIEPPPLPEELREPRVLLSSLAFEGLVASTADAGDITDVAWLADGSLALLDDGQPPAASAAGTAYGLAQVLLEQGRGDEALAWAGFALEPDRRSYGPDHPELARDRALRSRIEAARAAARPATELR